MARVQNLVQIVWRYTKVDSQLENEVVFGAMFQIDCDATMHYELVRLVVDVVYAPQTE